MKVKYIKWEKQGTEEGVSRAHIFFTNDLNVYQQNHRLLKKAYEIIAQESLDTGVCYNVSKCAKIVFGK